jgi:hypothetical protein
MNFPLGVRIRAFPALTEAKAFSHVGNRTGSAINANAYLMYRGRSTEMRNNRISTTGKSATSDCIDAIEQQAKRKDHAEKY